MRGFCISGVKLWNSIKLNARVQCIGVLSLLYAWCGSNDPCVNPTVASFSLTSESSEPAGGSAQP